MTFPTASGIDFLGMLQLVVDWLGPVLGSMLAVHYAFEVLFGVVGWAERELK